MGVLILSFIFLPLLFCAVLIVLMVPLWEKVVDFLNTVMDYVLPSSDKKTKTSVKSVKKNLSKTSDSTAAPKKKLPFWMQIQRVSPYKKKTALRWCLL
ncbi:MAG: hypothetical protein IKN43_00820, partial [Selenomonadaceae bacterium]|nr:hypothetical protein [Selenomonadaceae bacterium]